MSRFELSKFFPAPEPELICGICMNVLDTPYETLCRHVFCRDCIGKALRENSSCPICRASCTEDHLKEVLPLVQNLINKLTMRCDNYDSGCTELILKEFYLNHTKSCGYVMIQCQHKECGQYMLRKDYEDHETNICAYRDRICEGSCGLVIPLGNVESHNCVEALLAMVKELKREILELQKENCQLKEKKLELQKENDELKQVISGLMKAESPVSAGGHGDWVTSDDSYDGSFSWSSPSLSSFELSEVDPSDDDVVYRSHRRRSRRLAALSAERENSSVVEVSQCTDQEHNSQAQGNDDNDIENESAEENVDSVIIIEGDSTEFQTVEEIDNSVENSQRISENACVDSSVDLSGFCLQTANDSNESSCAVSDTSPRRNREHHSGSSNKRSCEDNSGEYEGDSNRENIKRVKMSPTSEAGFMPEFASNSDASDQGLHLVSKKYSYSHEETKPKNSSVPNKTSSGRNSSTSLSDKSESTSDLNISTDIVGKSNGSGASSSESTSTQRPGMNNESEENLPASRRGPAIRSRKQRRSGESKRNTIAYVKVPPTVSYLLNKYAEEDDSSNDESWSPHHEK